MRRGFTLIELVIAIAILSILLALPGIVVSTSSRAYSMGYSGGTSDVTMLRAVDDIAERLESASITTVPQAAAPGVAWSRIDFQRLIGLIGTAPSWGPPERIELAPEPGDPPDGVDNDRDGLTDERRILWHESFGLASQRTHVLANRVRATLVGEIAGNGLDDNGNGAIDEEGLLFTFNGERVGIQLTLERKDSYGVWVRRSAQRTVALRN